jgi:hypothetical protein
LKSNKNRDILGKVLKNPVKGWIIVLSASMFSINADNITRKPGFDPIHPISNEIPVYFA